ncbi:diguanylate cyclase [Trinickia sp. LjRoot230]|uniref:diguanylate cyclase n=1 Tax=Trinickia sp. LjRoot230 TaxID=3342288 RepID=UPI003ECD0DE2
MEQATLHRIVVAAGIAAVTAVCWIVAGIVADHSSARQLEDAVRNQWQLSLATADNIAQTVASDLSMARAIPATLAETSTIQQMLARSRDYAAKRPQGEPARRDQLLSVPEFKEADAFLHEARGLAGLDNIWLVDTQGICVASSNAFEPLSFVGVDISSRRYVQEALLGSPSQMYAVGRRSGENGIYISAPVYDDGILVGLIVAKIALRRLRHWVAAPGSFVADENGVIVIANDRRLEGYRLPGARVTSMDAAERYDDYRHITFPVLNIVPLPATIRREARWVPPVLANQMVKLRATDLPALYTTRGGINSGFSAHLLAPISMWPHMVSDNRNMRAQTFALLAGALLLVGTIAASYHREKRHHQEARRLAGQLQATNALLCAEARDDALTGALSRRYFLNLLQTEIDIARARGAPLCLALADLDHFKQINDRFGHTVGDRALEHFVDSCRLAVRADDAIGRLGGEEFAVLLPMTSLDDGLAIAERLRDALKAHRSERLPEEVSLRVSIGVTDLAPNDTLERIISRADRALYLAKSAGRDCVKVLAGYSDLSGDAQPSTVSVLR